LLRGLQQVIVTVDVTRCDVSRRDLRRSRLEGHRLLADHDLRALVIGDAAPGGPTDAHHLLGFGTRLHSLVVPRVEPGLPRLVQHVLDGGVEGRFPTVFQDSVPPLTNPARAVLIHKEILRPEGLLPCHSPDIDVYVPSYRMPGRWAVQRLTFEEKLRLYQMPLNMDPLLAV
jgi:hypothetical protein